MKTNPNYIPGHYDGPNPYREMLIKALKDWKITKFSENAQFWTLAGMQMIEYQKLVEAGIEFGPRSYHAVDREEFDASWAEDDDCVVKHERTEFRKIRRLDSFKSPVVINYDSTKAVVKSNDEDYKATFVKPVIRGLRKSPRIVAACNAISRISHCRFDQTEDEMYEVYVRRWRLFRNMILTHCGRKTKIEVYKQCSHHKRSNSRTWMIGFYALVTRNN